MYICESCNTQVGPRISANIVIIETREKIYPARQGDPGGSGNEIVKQINICTSCNNKRS